MTRFYEVRWRARLFIGIGTVAALVLVALVAMVLIQGADRTESRNADQRALLGVVLLVNVGAEIPELTPALLAHGLSNSQGAQLDAAVVQGQRRHVLSNLEIWDRSGRIVYSADAALEGTRPRLPADVAAALRGMPVTRRHASELDPSSGRHTGVLDAFEPLRDAHQRIYGAVETSLPLHPIVAAAAGLRTRILTYLVGGAMLLWLLLLPMTARAARAIAQTWVPGRRRTLRAFKRALTAREIELVYQPQVDPTTGRVQAVEALVRWRRHGELQTPDSFLPHVEGSPLMSRLTDRVLDLALGQLALWSKHGHSFRMSVNLSADDLSDRTLPARLQAALTRHRIPGPKLTVEVTETALPKDPDIATNVLAAISDLDIELAVDDFGTDHASISRLHQLRPQEVKIDRSFANSTDPSKRDYLAATVRFGQTLGLRVVAEGIEDAATHAFLRQLGCDLIQGYHISRPLDAPAMDNWLTDNAKHTPTKLKPAPPPTHRPNIAIYDRENLEAVSRRASSTSAV